VHDALSILSTTKLSIDRSAPPSPVLHFSLPSRCPVLISYNGLDLLSTSNSSIHTATTRSPCHRLHICGRCCWQLKLNQHLSDFRKILLYIFASVLYNLFLHPLRHYPGPRSWAASRIPWHRYNYAGTYHTQVHALHKKYGPVVRLAPNELSYTSSQAIKDIYSYRKDEPHEVPKDPLSQQRTVNGSPAILSAGREDHARYRRLLSHAFSDKGIREQESKIQRYVDLLMQRLGEHYAMKADQPLDLVAWFTWFTFDLIGKL
jgi:Cytochrome P450